MAKVGVLDVGIGNTISIKNALFALGEDCEIFEDYSLTQKFSHLIIPGVGAFDKGLLELRERGFEPEINRFRESSKPILGICLGMQMFFESSEEGGELGLGLLQGRISRIQPSETIRVPNTSWNLVEIIKPNGLLEVGAKIRAYHNHSFAFQDPSAPISTGVISDSPNLVVAAQLENLFGLQFHPEKSHSAGLKILKRFCDL